MALCTNCGDELFGGQICYKCGTRLNKAPSPPVPGTPRNPQAAPQQNQQYQYPPQQAGFQQQQIAPPTPKSGTNGFAIASLACSFFIAILGIIFGHIALSQIKKTGQAGKGIATAGLIISYVSAAFFFLLFI
jgi:peptidyl-prolyl cis-trans isomerase B (cyclophilin B)